VGQLTIYEDGKIRAFIVIDYQSYQPASATRAEPAVVRANSVSVFESGKKMMLLQAADPMSDRRTTIDVTATVLNSRCPGVARPRDPTVDREWRWRLAGAKARWELGVYCA
jgi:hypothetical protein